MRMRMIYVIRCTTNLKCYVGQTNNLKQRKASHFNRARAGVERPLYAAIRKHGEENFVFEILEECLNEVVNERERHWIAVFQCTDSNMGYNILAGGQDAFTHSEETRAKISKSKKGYRPSPNAIQKMKATRKARAVTPEEASARAKFGNYWKGRKRPKRKLTERELEARRANFAIGRKGRWKRIDDTQPSLLDQHR